MAFMKDSKGRRLDSFEIAPRSRQTPFETKIEIALRPFRAAYAAARSITAIAPARIIKAGDSRFEGYGTGSTLDSAVGVKLEEILRRRYPTAGEGVGLGRSFHPFLTAGAGMSTGWTIAGGTPTVALSKGYAANLAQCTTAGVTFTKTYPIGTTDIDIVGTAGSAITGITYTVDGGAVQAPAWNTGNTRAIATPITGLDPTVAHTLVITTVGNNNWLDGCIAYYGNKTKGLQVINCGHSGSRLTQYGQQSGSGNFSWYNPAAVNPATWSGFQYWTLTPPDLVLMNWKTNEFQGGAPEAASVTAAKYGEFIDSHAVQFPGRPISFLIVSQPKPGSVQTSASTYEEFVAAMDTVASTRASVAHVDLTKLLPPMNDATIGTTLYSGDQLHERPPGYAIEADAIASLIGA